MKINNISSQNFGARLTCNACCKYAKMYGPELTKKLINKYRDIGDKNLFLSGFNEFSLMKKFNVSIKSNKSPLNLTPEEVYKIQENLFEKAFLNAAKDADLQIVLSNMKLHYPNCHKTFDEIFKKTNIKKINTRAIQFQMKHPILFFAFGVRPTMLEPFKKFVNFVTRKGKSAKI